MGRSREVGVGRSSRLGFAARKTDSNAVLTIGWELGAMEVRGGEGEGFRVRSKED